MPDTACRCLRLSRVVAFSLASLATARRGFRRSARAAMPAKPKQVVIISFDSARDISQWQRSRALAQRTGAHFTYFLSCVFLLSPETRKEYTAPGKTAGKSNIGFAASKQEVAERLEQIGLPHRKATTSPAMPAAISTARTGARPTG